MTLEQHGPQKGKTSSENLFDSSQEAAAPPALLASREVRTPVFSSLVEDGVREGGLLPG